MSVEILRVVPVLVGVCSKIFVGLKMARYGFVTRAVGPNTCSSV